VSVTQTTLRAAVAGDLHCRKEDSARVREFVKQVNAEAELLLLCGDLTDRGVPEETRILVDALSGLRMPCAAVLGNHDWDAGLADEISERLHAVGVVVLDGEHVVLEGIGIAGIKGFGGGFEQRTLQAFGEPLVKAFVQEGVNEALKLEAALGQLDTPQKIVLLHYAPIAKTTEGEQPEIVAYLGTSRLAGPIDAYGADMVFHGHAHHGSLEGQTANGIKVYNVAAPLLRKTLGRSFRIVELQVDR
jgi:Icc-related predicted phosphoesterase